MNVYDGLSFVDSFANIEEYEALYEQMNHGLLLFINSCILKSREYDYKRN